MYNTKYYLDVIDESRADIKDLQDKITEAQRYLTQDAENLLKEVAKYEDIEGLDFLYFKGIKDGLILYQGQQYDSRDFYNQDTYVYYDYELEEELLYDEDFKKGYFQNLTKIHQEGIEEEKQLKMELNKQKQDKEKALLKELKKKYEDRE